MHSTKSDIDTHQNIYHDQKTSQQNLNEKD